jgi:hypothetical protein
MTYFSELSEYQYHRKAFDRPRTKNVGWLDREHHFPTVRPSEEFLDRLWRYCSVSVAQMRGFHDCELCPGERVIETEYKGQRLLLGTSEIRVFAEDGDIYAVPTLIFHYVQRHHYRPPEEFVAAVMRDPTPPDPAYFERLRQLQLEWRQTSAPTRWGQ